MIHPDAPLLLGIRAIDAQFRAKTGENTQPGPSSKPWLKSIYDPISAGELPSNNPQGMGQYGSKRWAWGLNEADQAYPKWDYRRILVHYYTGIQFVGATNPDPPEGFRANMLKIEGVPANGLTLCRGEERTGIRVMYQNTGQWAWPVDGTDSQGLCAGPVPDYKTLLGHHLYQSSSSTPACSNASNCIGIRRTPMCRISTIQPGEHFWVNGFKIKIPDDSALVKGNTYQLRFDVEHRHNGVWDGYPSYNWPGQDIPVTICGGSGGGGGGSVGVRILDHPPAVVSYNTLNNGYFRFSWQGINQPDGYDVQYRSKEILEASYPASFEAPPHLQNMHPTITELPVPVHCNPEDRKDWQFRIRADKAGQSSSNWVYVEAQLRVYPHPWPIVEGIGTLQLNADPGPWPAIGGLTNLGGGTFNWTATSNQSWIEITNPSGQGEGSFGLVLRKPVGGSGDYYGNLTVTTSNPVPSPNCNPRITFTIPITVGIRDILYYQYLPIIFKNSQ